VPFHDEGTLHKKAPETSVVLQVAFGAVRVTPDSGLPLKVTVPEIVNPCPAPAHKRKAVNTVARFKRTPSVTNSAT
jgi:hypothetical protein